MQVGLQARNGGIIDIKDFNDYYQSDPGATDVLVENAAYHGLLVKAGSSASIDGGASFRIVGAGQPWGGDTAGVTVSDGSVATLAAQSSNGALLEIAGSHELPRRRGRKGHLWRSPVRVSAGWQDRAPAIGAR